MVEPLVVGGRRGGVLTLQRPVLTAAGCFGDGTLFASAPWLGRLGAIVTHSITLRPRAHRRGRVLECASGVLYTATLPNAGVDATIRRCAAVWSGLPVPVVVSIAGESPGDVVRLASELEGAPGVAALELNVAPALVDAAEAGEAPAALERIVEAVAAATSLPLLVKLSPSAQTAEAARAAERGGADAVVVGHGWPAATGGRLAGWEMRLAGPAVAPLALRLVEQACEAITIPVVACGGIYDGGSAGAAFAAGAAAVQVGAALLRDPTTAARIAAELAGEPLLDPGSGRG